MTLEEKARLSCYQTVAVLNEAHQVFLVQHSADRSLQQNGQEPLVPCT